MLQTLGVIVLTYRNNTGKGDINSFPCARLGARIFSWMAALFCPEAGTTVLPILQMEKARLAESGLLTQSCGFQGVKAGLDPGSVPPPPEAYFQPCALL